MKNAKKIYLGRNKRLMELNDGATPANQGTPLNAANLNRAMQLIADSMNKNQAT